VYTHLEIFVVKNSEEKKIKKSSSSVLAKWRFLQDSVCLYITP